MNLRRTLVTGACACLLSACAGLPIEAIYRSPEFSHRDTRLTGLTWTRLQGRSTVALSNPNPFGLPVTRLEGSLWLEGEHWLDLEAPPLDGLAADGTTELDFDWAVTVPGLMDRARQAYQAGAASMELRLVTTVDVPVLGTRQLKGRHAFTVPVPKTPSVRLVDWQLESLSMSEITLNLDLRLTNPNRFNLTTGPWSIDVGLSGRELSGLSLEPLSLPAGESRDHRTRVSLAVAGLGPTLFNGLRTGTWPDNLTLDWQGAISSPELGLDLPPVEGQVAF